MAGTEEAERRAERDVNVERGVLTCGRRSAKLLLPVFGGKRRGKFNRRGIARVARTRHRILFDEILSQTGAQHVLPSTLELYNCISGKSPVNDARSLTTREWELIRYTE